MNQDIRRKQIKESAKAMLRSCWGMAIAVHVVLLLVSFGLGAIQNSYMAIFQPEGLTAFYENLLQGKPMNIAEVYQLTHRSIIISLVFGLLTFFVATPLQHGVIAWYRHAVSGRSEPISVVFRYYSGGKLYFRSLLFQFLLNIRILVITLVAAVIPPVGAIGLGALASGLKASGSGLYIPVTLLTALLGLVSLPLLVGASIYVQKYMAAPYMLVSADSMSAGGAISRSVRLTRGHLMELFIFNLSFIGWILLSSFTCGILSLIYVAPYISFANAIFVQYLESTQTPQRPAELPG